MNFHYQLLFGSVTLILSLYSDRLRELDKDKFLNEKSHNGLPKIEEYDFIIVGGGSAGGVLTYRLSAQYKVLLIEIGGDPPPQTDIPNFYPHFFPHPQLSHQWTSTVQKYSSLDFGSITTISQGNVLGGSSTINAMQYNRGSPEDYNNWARITSDDTWSYDKLLKYFQMSEDYQHDFANESMGFGGPMGISHCALNSNKMELELAKAWKNSGNELGFDYFDSPNGPQKEGFTSFHETKRNGRRVSTWNSFIQPALNRDTLTIHRYSEAQKVHFDVNGQAIGVFYKRHGVYQYAKAKKEIILSAGALNSPLILMNSGIGPKDQLENAKIPVRVDLPVGQYFQDHTSVPLSLFQVQNDPELDDLQKSAENFLQNGSGILSKNFYYFGQAFIQSDASKNISENGSRPWPDIQFMNLMFAKNDIELNNLINTFVVLGRPSSYGTVELNPQDSKLPLIFNPNYLSNQYDRDRLIQGVKLAFKIADSKSYENLGLIKTTKFLNYSKCSHFEKESENYFECLISHLSGHFFHPVGTCRMGRKDDDTATVDSQLKVIGVKGLRVIDNSIQPAIVNTNTNAAAIVIGQKGADMILKEWRFKKEYLGHVEL